MNMGVSVTVPAAASMAVTDPDANGRCPAPIGIPGLGIPPAGGTIGPPAPGTGTPTPGIPP